MAFFVGQKVVRITDGPWFFDDPSEDLPGPRKGEVCTVTRSFKFCGLPSLELAEYSTDGEGYLASDFRPVVERKTNIEIFTRMLTDKKVKINEPA